MIKNKECNEKASGFIVFMALFQKILTGAFLLKPLWYLQYKEYFNLNYDLT